MSGDKPPPLPLRYRWKYATIPLTYVWPVALVLGTAAGFWAYRNLFPEWYIQNRTPIRETPIPKEDFDEMLDFDYGFCSIKGRAPVMEDRAWLLESEHQTFLGVFDGTGAPLAADVVSQSWRMDVLHAWKKFSGNIPNLNGFLLRASYSVNKQLERFNPRLPGTVAASIVTHDHNLIKVASVGNCATFVCNSKRPRLLSWWNSFEDKSISNDKHPMGIYRLLVEWIDYGPLRRTAPIMNEIIRFYGDGKPERVDAELTEWEICKEDEYVVTGTSGLWNVLRPIEAVEYLQGLRLVNPNLSANYMARSLVYRALAMGSTENITAGVIVFKHYDPEILFQEEKDKRLSPGRMIISAIMRTH